MKHWGKNICLILSLLYCVSDNVLSSQLSGTGLLQGIGRTQIQTVESKIVEIWKKLTGNPSLSSTNMYTSSHNVSGVKVYATDCITCNADEFMQKISKHVQPPTTKEYNELITHLNREEHHLPINSIKQNDKSCFIFEEDVYDIEECIHTILTTAYAGVINVRIEKRDGTDPNLVIYARIPREKQEYRHSGNSHRYGMLYSNGKGHLSLIDTLKIIIGVRPIGKGGQEFLMFYRSLYPEFISNDQLTTNETILIEGEHANHFSLQTPGEKLAFGLLMYDMISHAPHNRPNPFVLQKDKTKLEQEIKDLKVKISSYIEQINEYQQQLTNNADSFTERNNTIKSLQQQLRTSEQNIKKLTKGKDKLQQQYNTEQQQLEKSMAEYKTREDKLRDKIGQLQSAIIKQRADYKTESEKRDRMILQLQQQLEKSMVEYKTKEDKLRDKIGQLQSIIIKQQADYKTESEKRDRMILQLQQQLEKSMAEYKTKEDKLRDKIGQLQSVIIKQQAKYKFDIQSGGNPIPIVSQMISQNEKKDDVELKKMKPNVIAAIKLALTDEEKYNGNKRALVNYSDSIEELMQLNKQASKVQTSKSSVMISRAILLVKEALYEDDINNRKQKLTEAIKTLQSEY